MVQEFFNQESEYDAYLRGRRAYVFNDFGAGEGRLHHADCAMLNRAGPAAHGNHTSVRKICSYDLASLEVHVRANVGAEGSAYQKCSFCFKPDDARA